MYILLKSKFRNKKTVTNYILLSFEPVEGVEESTSELEDARFSGGGCGAPGRLWRIGPGEGLCGALRDAGRCGADTVVVEGAMPEIVEDDVEAKCACACG